MTEVEENIKNVIALNDVQNRDNIKEVLDSVEKNEHIKDDREQESEKQSKSILEMGKEFFSKKMTRIQIIGVLLVAIIIIVLILKE